MKCCLPVVSRYAIATIAVAFSLSACSTSKHLTDSTEMTPGERILKFERRGSGIDRKSVV